MRPTSVVVRDDVEGNRAVESLATDADVRSNAAGRVHTWGQERGQVGLPRIPQTGSQDTALTD